MMTSDQIGLLRSLKGAPASIVLALVFCGHALKNRELEQMTGYSDKPISKGLALLELHRLVQYNGYAYGWSLTAAARQLPLFPDSLLGDGQSRNISEVGEFPTSSSSSSSSLLTLNGHREEEEDAAESRRISDFSPRPVDNSVDKLRRTLIQAGVGKRSRKLRELLDAGLAIEYVQGHIAARQAALDQGKHYPVGWLIQKLLDGDPVPAAKPTAQAIPPEYEHIIKR